MDGISIVIGSGALIVSVGGFVVGSISHRLKVTEKAQQSQCDAHKKDLNRIYDKIDASAKEQSIANEKLIKEHAETRILVAGELGTVKANLGHLKETVDLHIKQEA